MKNIGVYKIINKIDGKIYIGSSLDLKRRFKEHKSHLKRDKHCNRYLQRAWNKYGEDNFEFIILNSFESIECKDLLILEQEQIDLFKSYDSSLGYNLSKTADRNSGWHMTESAKQKIREKNSGVLNYFFGKHHTNEVKQLISKVHKGKIISQEHRDSISRVNKGCKRGIVSIETRQKISLANKGKVRDEETKLKLSLSSIGKNHSEETKEKIRTANIGRKHTEEVKLKMRKPKSEETKLKMSKTRLERKIRHTEKTKKQISDRMSNENNPRARKINMFTEKGEYLRTFLCIKEAKTFIGKGDIKRALKSFERTAGGFKWKYSINDGFLSEIEL